jgi:hypothetical protein
MKNLYITCFNQGILKNLLKDDLLDLLNKYYVVKIVTYDFKVDYFRVYYSNKYEIIGFKFKKNLLERIFRRIFIVLQLTEYQKFRNFELAGITKKFAKINLYFSKLLNSNYYFFKSIFYFFINLYSFYLLFIKKNLSYTTNGYLLITDIFSEEDIYICNRNKNKKNIIGMVRSWDNCYTKGLLRIKFNKILVNNNDIKYDLLNYHFVNNKSIKEIGFPQYNLTSILNFYSLGEVKSYLGLKKQKYIVFCPGGSQLTNLDQKIYDDLRDLLNNDFSIIVRNHPGHPSSVQTKPDDIIQKDFFYKYSGKPNKYCDFNKLDNMFYMYILNYADFIVSVASSVVIDSLFLKKKQIIANYNENENKINRYLNEEHMAKFINSEAAYVAKNKKDLELFINLESNSLKINLEHNRRFNIKTDFNINLLNNLSK